MLAAPVALATPAVTTSEDVVGDYSFQLTDFVSSNPNVFDPNDFASASANTIQFVSLKSLPTNGQLILNGAPLAAITDVPVSLIGGASPNRLFYRPTGDKNGPSLSTFDFTVKDSGLSTGGNLNESAQVTMLVDVTAVNDAPASSPKKTSETIRRWPEEEIGRNSVSPCTAPSTMACTQVMDSPITARPLPRVRWPSRCPPK